MIAITLVFNGMSKVFHNSKNSTNCEQIDKNHATGSLPTTDPKSPLIRFSPQLYPGKNSLSHLDPLLNWSLSHSNNTVNFYLITVILKE